MMYKKFTFFHRILLCKSNVRYGNGYSAMLQNDLNMLEFCMIKAMHHNIIVIQVSIQGIYIYNIRTLSEEELEYTKGVIRIRK